MKSYYRKAAGLLGATALLACFGCSENSSTNFEPLGSALDVQGSSVVSVGSEKALARLSLCTRNIAHYWSEEAISAAKTISVAIDESFVENSFGVEADAILLESAGYITLASAGVDGDQDAWALRVENGKPLFAWRDVSTKGEWYKLEADVTLKLNELITIRAERIDSLTVLYVDGEIIAAVISDSEIKSMEGSFTIGFDPTMVTDNTSGRVMCVRFEKVHDMPTFSSNSEVKPAEEDTPVFEVGVVGSEEKPAATESENTAQWIADWEFNDPQSVGKDYSGNGHTAVLGEGSVTSVDGVAVFDGKSGFDIDLANDLKINSFVVEARVKPSKFASMQNILIAEPPGRYGDGWMLRADDGSLAVHFRDAAKNGTDWKIFVGENLVLNEWNEIRVERSNNHIKMFQNGVLTVDADYDGNVSDIAYDWAIGYDGMNQSYHNRYFVGEMDYVRFGTLDKMSEGSLTSSSPYVLLADWEFNEPAFVGLDRMANNTCKYVEGNAKIIDGALSLDGESGLPISLSSTFMRGEFAVEARVMPTAFGDMQNIIVAEPPGRYGDGWIIRVDNGVLKVQFRDESLDGTEWNVFEGKALELNQWTKIQVVLADETLKVYQDGELTVETAYAGDVGQLGYGLGIGYDAVYQRIHDRGFVGAIDYIRYYGIRH